MDADRSRPALAAPSLFVLLLVPALATAQEQPRVYIVSVPMSDELEAVSARVGAAARAALRDVEGVNWQGPDQLFLGYDDSVLDRLQSGRQKLAEGRQAYIDLDLGRAITLLTAAVADFDAAAIALEDPTDLSEALLLLGAAQSFENRSRDARRTFERLHVQMPDRRPDPQQFNPDVVQRYEQAAPRDRDAPVSSITIESDPPGAIAYVDFIARGRTPITVEGLMGGQHIVRVTRPGATPFLQPVDVPRGGTQSVNAFLQDVEATQGLSESLTEIVAADVTRIGERSPIGAVATILELDKIGVIRVSPTDAADRVALELLLFDVASGRRLLRGAGQVPTAPGQLEPAVGQLVNGGLTAGLRPAQSGDDEEAVRRRPDPEPEPEPVGPAGPAPPLTQRWYFWAGVGGAAALVVTLIVVLASSGGDQQLGRDPSGQLVLEF